MAHSCNPSDYGNEGKKINQEFIVILRYTRAQGQPRIHETLLQKTVVQEKSQDPGHIASRDSDMPLDS